MPIATASATTPAHRSRDRWLKFFTEAESLDAVNLPEWMQTPVMRQAMSTLTAFSEKERAYHADQARQEFLREQRAIEQALERERQAKEAERQAKEAALAEVERLKALLAQRPDA